MKRILLVIESLGSGGAERQMCGLATLLTRAGYTCRLISYIDNQFYESYLRQNNVDYQFVPELSNKWTRIPKVAKYVRQYKADIVISFLQAVNMTLCLAKPLYKAKLIVSERNNNISVSNYDRVLFNTYRLADAVVPNSNSQGEFIKNNFPFLSSKVFPIINFVDVNRFFPVKEKIKNETLRIITVGRYVKQKNVLTYMKAVRKIKEKQLNIHFDWFGDKTHNETEYFKQILKLYETLDISDYMTLHDQNPSIEHELQKSDVFCLPSLFEGYPNVIAEAMSCGLPVICSNKYENPYIVKNGENGFLFDPENTDDIVDAIYKVVLLKPEERVKMGIRNRKICLYRNTEEAFVQAYIQLIEKL